MQYAGRARTATLVLPDGPAPREGWSVVLLLHGGGGNAEQMLRTTGWRDVAARERFVLVGANGTAQDETRRARFLGNPQTWNSGTGSGLSVVGESAFAKQVDDSGFLVALLDTVARRTQVNAKRVYIAGHSNGAGMTYRVAAEHPERFAAAGVMGGHLLTDVRNSLVQPVPLVQIVGDQDPLVPMSGGPVRLGGSSVTLRPALEAPTRWAAINGLTGPGRIVRDDSVTVRAWGTSPRGAVVESYVVKGHGHGWLWPRSGDRLPARLIGPTRNALNATETMWAFFAAHHTP